MIHALIGVPIHGRNCEPHFGAPPASCRSFFPTPQRIGTCSELTAHHSKILAWAAPKPHDQTMTTRTCA
jgi:hypothetical protein